MLEPDRIRQIVHDTYAARQRGDTAALTRHFAPDAIYRLTGDRSRLGNFPAGPIDATEAVTALIGGFTFETLEPVQILVDGQQAAIHYTVRAMVASNGHHFTTEIADFLTFDADGRITELVEFADTGAIAHMVGSGLI